jgi:Rv2525c-like, glycoside hydrolase-like domain
MDLLSVARCIKAAIRVGTMLPILAFGCAPAIEKDYCVANSGAAAVDLSSRVNQEFLDKMKDVGVHTIIRYYDYEDETIPGKTLRRKERDLIIANGFRIAVVFQHNNDKFASFTPTRGQQDAERSLVLAAENSQPKGSGIYFGVDGGWETPDELANIKSYFTAVQAALDGKGYRIGVYGSGLVCEKLLQDGLAKLCWLANAKSWPGYNAYYNTMNWSLVQLVPADLDCGGQEVDFNLTNGKDVDHGQFTR